MYMSNICKTVTLRTRKIKGGASAHGKSKAENNYRSIWTTIRVIATSQQ